MVCPTWLFLMIFLSHGSSDRVFLWYIPSGLSYSFRSMVLLWYYPMVVLLNLYIWYISCGFPMVWTIKLSLDGFPMVVLASYFHQWLSYSFELWFEHWMVVLWLSRWVTSYQFWMWFSYESFHWMVVLWCSSELLPSMVLNMVWTMEWALDGFPMGGRPVVFLWFSLSLMLWFFYSFRLWFARYGFRYGSPMAFLVVFLMVDPSTGCLRTESWS